MIVKSKSTFAAQANTINVAGDNGLFLVGNTVAVSAGDTFDAESQNVKVRILLGSQAQGERQREREIPSIFNDSMLTGFVFSR